MSEKFAFTFFQMNKTVTNPINRNEVFNCSDIYNDYAACKALSLKGKMKKIYCPEYRKLGQQCYLNSEEEFQRILIKKFDEKKKYIEYLKNEDSILYHVYINNPNTFSIAMIHNSSQVESAGEINKNIK